MLTSMHTTFIHPSLSIQQTFNPFHVYMYISHWGSERQSPSLEIIFDPLLMCTSVLPSPGQQTVPNQQRRWKLVSQHSMLSLIPLPISEHFLASLTQSTPPPSPPSHLIPHPSRP